MRLGQGNYGCLVTITHNQVQCCQPNSHEGKPLDWAHKNFVVKILSYSKRVDDEIAALNSAKIYRATNNKFGALGAWKYGNKIFLLLARRITNVGDFIENLKKYYEQKGLEYKVPVSLVKIFTIQLLKQINCYQDNNICHGDIKMANSLVDVKDDCVNFIFCDYGLVGTAEFQEDNLEFGGTPLFISPERVKDAENYENYSLIKASSPECENDVTKTKAYASYEQNNKQSVSDVITHDFGPRKFGIDTSLIIFIQ